MYRRIGADETIIINFLSQNFRPGKNRDDSLRKMNKQKQAFESKLVNAVKENAFRYYSLK